MLKKYLSLFLVIFHLSACATSRDLSSSHYLPEWENRFFSVPAPGETTGGYWAVRSMHAAADGLGHLLLFPLAAIGNIVINLYYIVTWPIRWPLFGDKRLIVWYPLFAKGEKIGSRHFSKEWNEDLS